MTQEEIKHWLDQEPTEIEFTEDDKPAAYIPIWAVENYLDQFSDNGWERFEHKYSFHKSINSDITMLSTSHLLKARDRILLCSSFIDTSQYADTKNILQTGIAEATKAGVKVLGRKFGKHLNERTVLKPKVDKKRRKAHPDAQIMKAYMKAVIDKDNATIDRLSNIYDIKQETNVA